MADPRTMVAIAEAAIASFDSFATAVTTVAERSAHPPLVAAALRERLHAPDDEHTHVLFVGLKSAGGETITRRSLFGRSGEVGFLGGAHVSYLLLNVERNRTVAAGTQSLCRNLKYNPGDSRVHPATWVELDASGG